MPLVRNQTNKTVRYVTAVFEMCFQMNSDSVMHCTKCTQLITTVKHTSSFPSTNWKGDLTENILRDILTVIQFCLHKD